MSWWPQARIRDSSIIALSQKAMRLEASDAKEAARAEWSASGPNLEDGVLQDTAKISDSIRHWASFGSLLRRIVASVMQEVRGASLDTESETSAVINRFQEVAGKAKAQSERVGRLSTLANTIPIDGKDVPLAEMTTLLDATLSDSISKIEFASRRAALMVNTLDEMVKSLGRVEQCIAQVDTINGQTNMLALNARIEANRAGEAGKAFAVIANEIRELSKSTQSLSETMRAQMNKLGACARESHEALRAVATTDMSTLVVAKGKVDQLVGAMVHRGSNLSEIVSEAANDAKNISRQIDQIITGMQFQDRVTQRLEQVTDTLAVLSDGVRDLQGESSAAVPTLVLDQSPRDIAWLKELSSRYKLSDMRAQFVIHVIEGQEKPVVQDRDARGKRADTGSVELF